MLSDEDRSVSRGEYFVSGILSTDSHNSYFSQNNTQRNASKLYLFQERKES